MRECAQEGEREREMESTSEPRRGREEGVGGGGRQRGSPCLRTMMVPQAKGESEEQGTTG